MKGALSRFPRPYCATEPVRTVRIIAPMVLDGAMHGGAFLACAYVENELVSALSTEDLRSIKDLFTRFGN